MPQPYTEVEEYQLSQRVLLHRGDIVKVSGLRGNFRFVKVRTYDDGTLEATLHGPLPGYNTGRYITPDRITRRVMTAEEARQQ